MKKTYSLIFYLHTLLKQSHSHLVLIISTKPTSPSTNKRNSFSMKGTMGWNCKYM